MNSMDKEYTDYLKKLNAAQKNVLDILKENSAEPKNTGYMGENIMIMDFSPAAYKKATELVNDAEKLNASRVNLYASKKRIAIIF